MLEGGEDPRFIVRRMVILASEDIGNADPQALRRRHRRRARRSTASACPECALNLAQAAIYLALAPKSNAATRGIAAAMRHVREHGAKLPPDYLRDAHYPGAKKLGRGQGYVYPHDEPGGVADQALLPPEVAGERFYEPTDRGFEGERPQRPARAFGQLSGYARCVVAGAPVVAVDGRRRSGSRPAPKRPADDHVQLRRAAS